MKPMTSLSSTAFVIDRALVEAEHKRLYEELSLDLSLTEREFSDRLINGILDFIRLHGKKELIQ